LSAARRAPRTTVLAGSPGHYVPPTAFPTGEITYKGYRIEPASYCVNSTAWSPRVIVSVKADGGWLPRAPLYASNAARFPTRPDADRSALDIARAWIDTAEKPATD
jgi:hypothetical protein